MVIQPNSRGLFTNYKDAKSNGKKQSACFVYSKLSTKSLYQFLPATCSPWQLGAHQNVFFQLQPLNTISNLMVPCFNFNTAITYVSINPATTQPRTGSFFGFGVSQKNIHRRTNLGTAAFPDVTRHDTEDMTSLTNLAIRKSNHENHQNTWLKTCKHHINCNISQKLELYIEHFSHMILIPVPTLWGEVG